MAAPSPLTQLPGLQVIAEVSAMLGSGLDTDETLQSVLTAIKSGLGIPVCRLWLRGSDGVSYAPSPGSTELLPGERESNPVEGWIKGGPTRTPRGLGTLVRLPLLHDDVPFGALEAVVPGGPTEHMAHAILGVLAGILAPLLAATELSQDLASDVAARTRELEAQRNFAARIIDSLPVGLYVIDADYVIRAWNRKRESGTQGVAREDAVGRPVFDVLDRQPRDLLQREFNRVFETGEIQQVEMESQATRDARYYRITKIPMRIEDDRITHVITIGEDVTEWREAQHRLAQTEKLAAIGQLAAGVMHEINNPLATILACAEALKLRDDGSARGDEYLEIIDKEVQRCRKIIDRLLDFSRPRTGEKRVVDINDVIEQTLFLLKHHERFKRMVVTREFTLGLPTIPADPERLIQSFMALLLNAMDAMNSRGALTVRSGKNPERDDELLIEFIDRGVGIKKEELSKIFEPFFTTKPQGRGTGLGLSICYGIIADHRGRIEVESQIGIGSTFKVYLPLG
jgi:two-component system NtrC family sensor kinase